MTRVLRCLAVFIGALPRPTRRCQHEPHAATRPICCGKCGRVL